MTREDLLIHNFIKLNLVSLTGRKGVKGFDLPDLKDVVYAVVTGDTAKYIGSTSSLKDRFNQHKSLKSAAWKELTIEGSELWCLELSPIEVYGVKINMYASYEVGLIRHFKPELNKTHADSVFSGNVLKHDEQLLVDQAKATVRNLNKLGD